MIETQQTQPLSRFARADASETETPQMYYQHLKAVSNATGVRLLFVYLSQQHHRTDRPRPRFYKTRWFREGR